MEFAPSAKKSLTNPYQTAIMIWQETELPQTEYAPLAQLDRALVYGTKGWGFELLMAHHVATRRILQALAIRQGLCFLRRLLLFPKNLASQSFLGSLINVSKAAFRSARLSAGTILLPLAAPFPKKSLLCKSFLGSLFLHDVFCKPLPFGKGCAFYVGCSSSQKILLRNLFWDP